MKTSYFSGYRGPGAISIARYKPDWYRGLQGVYSKLAPGPWFNTVDHATYERLFSQQLSRLDAQTVYDDLVHMAGGDEPVLLCWEALKGDKPGEFCHRRMVAEWLERELGIEVAEWKKPEPEKPAPPPPPPPDPQLSLL